MKTDVSQLDQTMGRVDRGTTRKELEVILGHSVSDFEYRVFRRDVAEMQHGVSSKMLLNFFDESIVARLTSDAAMELPKVRTIPGAFWNEPQKPKDMDRVIEELRALTKEYSLTDMAIVKAFDDVPPQDVSLPDPIPTRSFTVLKNRWDRDCPSDDPFQFVY